MLRKKCQANLHPDTHTHIWDPRKNDKTCRGMETESDVHCHK